MNFGIVMPNLAALRGAVFTLSGKKPQGGGGRYPPPVGARVKLGANSSIGAPSLLDGATVWS